MVVSLILLHGKIGSKRFHYSPHLSEIRLILLEIVLTIQPRKFQFAKSRSIANKENYKPRQNQQTLWKNPPKILWPWQDIPTLLQFLVSLIVKFLVQCSHMLIDRIHINSSHFFQLRKLVNHLFYMQIQSLKVYSIIILHVHNSIGHLSHSLNDYNPEQRETIIIV